MDYSENNRSECRYQYWLDYSTNPYTLVCLNLAVPQTTNQWNTTNLNYNPNNNSYSTPGLSHIAFWDTGGTTPPTDIPEPTTAALLGLGMLALGAIRRRKATWGSGRNRSVRKFYNTKRRLLRAPLFFDSLLVSLPRIARFKRCSICYAPHSIQRYKCLIKITTLLGCVI